MWRRQSSSTDDTYLSFGCEGNEILHVLRAYVPNMAAPVHAPSWLADKVLDAHWFLKKEKQTDGNFAYSSDHYPEG